MSNNKYQISDEKLNTLMTKTFGLADVWDSKNKELRIPDDYDIKPEELKIYQGILEVAKTPTGAKILNQLDENQKIDFIYDPDKNTNSDGYANRDGIIAVNIKSIERGKKSIVRIIAHELTHHLQFQSGWTGSEYKNAEECMMLLMFCEAEAEATSNEATLEAFPEENIRFSNIKERMEFLYQLPSWISYYFKYKKEGLLNTHTSKDSTIAENTIKGIQKRLGLSDDEANFFMHRDNLTCNYDELNNVINFDKDGNVAEWKITDNNTITEGFSTHTISELLIDNKQNFTREKRYNLNDQLIEEKEYRDQKLDSITQIKYNVQGILVESQVYFYKSGKFDRSYQKKYNNKGILTENKSIYYIYDKKGKIDHIIVKKYNNNGVLIENKKLEAPKKNTQIYPPKSPLQNYKGVRQNAK